MTEMKAGYTGVALMYTGSTVGMTWTNARYTGAGVVCGYTAGKSVTNWRSACKGESL